MEELIFYGIIALFVVIDALVKGARKKQGPADTEEERGEAGGWEPAGWDEERVSTYDEELSHDDRFERETTEYTVSYETTRAPEPVSSESMIPKDVWDEIRAIARGEAPKPAEAEPEPTSWHVPAPRPSTAPVKPQHDVHLSHLGYGTDPSSRIASEQDGLDPLRATLDRDAAAARRLLRKGDSAALRRAIILKEILSPPLAMRDE